MKVTNLVTSRNVVLGSALLGKCSEEGKMYEIAQFLTNILVSMTVALAFVHLW